MEETPPPLRFPASEAKGAAVYRDWLLRALKAVLPMVIPKTPPHLAGVLVDDAYVAASDRFNLAYADLGVKIQCRFMLSVSAVKVLMGWLDSLIADLVVVEADSGLASFRAEGGYQFVVRTMHDAFPDWHFLREGRGESTVEVDLKALKACLERAQLLRADVVDLELVDGDTLVVRYEGDRGSASERVGTSGTIVPAKARVPRSQVAKVVRLLSTIDQWAELELPFEEGKPVSLSTRGRNLVYLVMPVVGG
ncbi:MAG: hypothetical protein DRO18_05515 [Thermoprotei archaeon]|nr:MAG: hypothetical protein DRO18_05515 [Thermoprotei archaeon]